ncbi:uncharacterized protein LOC130646273 [Hydractinia symbiolongicarpus]|uniref:uncharacterized protein LOC130646273 n=1 Tax=Hydractinia symbiolongicarpus TaxID=13093 RepID=UPI00254D3C1E|nr:uncharacterized protein LOC130646273 [Hydractinia symbiolongicarpus]
MKYVLFGAFLLVNLGTLESITCGFGKEFCKLQTCVKDLKCKGNVGRTFCDCCDVCLKQENETCGVIEGKCDYKAPICAKLPGTHKKCVTMKTVLKHRIRLYMREIRTSCKKSKSYKGYNVEKIFKCFLNSVGSQYYCLKKPTYNPDEKSCCVHPNKCNPDPDIYENIDVYVPRDL